MVYILLAPGFEEMEALVPADLLRRAGVEVELVGVSQCFVSGGREMVVRSDILLEEVRLEDADMIVLPGGGVGVENLGKAPEVERLVRAAGEQGVWIAAICAAPTLLCKWGLLEDRDAVCYPTWSDRLTGAKLQEGEKVVVDGKFVTAQAAGASFEFGLKLIEVLVGAETAQRIRKEICL